MAKRASASSSSGQPSQPKRPRFAPADQPWNGSNRNLELGSCLTEEDAQRVCGEEPEPAKSHSAEYCRSCTGNSLKDIVQQMHSEENSLQKLGHVDAIVKKAFHNWNTVTEFNGETFSGSIPSQVLQIENLTPVRRNLVPATPSGPEAPPENVGFVAEGHDGATASALQVQLQNTDSENAMKLSVDESGHLAAQQPISTDPLNVLIPQGDIHSSSQMHHTGNENAPPEGNHLMGNLQPFVSDDMDYVLAFLSQSPPYDVEFFKTPLYDGGSVSGTSKSVNGWLKIKAVMRWGFFIRKIVMKRRGIMVQPPVEVEA